MDRPYRLLLVEDHAILRDGLRALFTRDSQFEVVGEAGDGLEAISLAAQLHPDLVLLDLNLPRVNGTEVIGDLRRVSPRAKVLVLTVHKEEEYLLAALRAGADGYVSKEASSHELRIATLRVLEGHKYLSPQVSSRVIEGYLGGRTESSGRSTLDGLTEREREVLKLVAEGHRNREIAALLCISPKTVEKHRASLMEKLKLRNTAGVVAYAHEKGILTK